MPEGHTIHRLSAALSELYGGQRLAAFSPQGRFTAGAERLDGQVLLGAQAHGKHLFLPFAPEADVPTDDAAVTWLRIHLGLYGSWTFDGDASFTAPHAIGAPRRRVGERGEHALAHGGGSALSGLAGGSDDVPAAPAPGQWRAPEPRGAVRLRLLGEHGVADLTGPAACELLDAEGVAAVRRRLGPDPLRADGDRELFVANVRRRRKAVGELLMDQSVISGVGNIYRAETLLRCGISPFLSGAHVSRARLRAVWDDLVPLMEYGVATGFITTVEPDDVPVPLPEGDDEAARWYVYHRADRPCLRCATPVRQKEVAGRRLFWCPTCQAY
ncbi:MULTISPECIES: Fpg/Nei family DNA glycosylase [Actinomyces]|uniref:DNA-(apurinic or apyrimidinic site) lyase n=1 Tax=Actinomyces respiraculi TaxID=2744574 RepID=A0A7T0LN23_9ACTO|nr:MULTISPECIES: DNA-formamidopyrimidine glycosylase family protein [Actinomyces]QPL06153.1 Fpg/Nei family DNA glycosylase [Actinomyces respiraculi]